MEFELYEQVARVGKAIGHGTRLELLELMAQAEQSVDDMARITATGITSVSAHLQVLKRVGLVRTRREGTKIYYRLAAPEVAGLFVAMKSVAGDLLPTASSQSDSPHAAQRPPVPLVHAVEEARKAFMLDVRPEREFAAGHLPGAVSIPLDELPGRAEEVPLGQRVVVYCRGEFCLMARDAVRMLRARGVDAYAMDEGVLEWRARGAVDLRATA
jgi:rhodanese-related sulfurtransferase